MRKGLLWAVAALLAGSGLAVAEPPARMVPVPATEPPLFGADQAAKPAGKPAGAPTTALPADKAAPVKPADPCVKDCPDPCLPKCCEVCGPPGRCWVSAEYLLWWIRPDNVPPLVTTSPASSLGILGQPGTRVLIGGDSLDDDPLHGGRFVVGTWLDCCQTKGIEIGYFFLSSRSTELAAGGNGQPGSPTIARPFFNVLTGRQDSELVNLPGVVGGNVIVNSDARLQGLTPNLICNLHCCGPVDCCNPHGYRVDLLVGPRIYHLEEDVTIREDLSVNPTIPVLGGSRIRIRDTFDTENFFYGGFLGARAEVWRNRCFVNVTGGAALGNTHQRVRIDGTTAITPASGATVNRTGGLLTQQSNIGRYSRDEFSVIPELSVNVGYQVTHCLRAFVGYNLIYWTNVVRPGEQIDTGLNTTQLPTLGGQSTLVGPARPTFRFNDTDFWAQGVSVGVQFRY